MGQRVYESMTKVVLGPNLVVRVWCTEKSLFREGPRAMVYEALQPFRGAYEWPRDMENVAKALDALGSSVAAYEILDSNGNGIVVYNDWP